MPHFPFLSFSLPELQINVNSFDIDDLAAEAQCRSDIVGLVEGVKSRLRSHQAMLAEIDELQTK